MHTPGHATINVAVLGGLVTPAFSFAVLIGAVLPDVPIIVLYIKERWIKKTPESLIWSEVYQRPFWLNLVHLAHSIPLASLGLVLGFATSEETIILFFASMLVHILCDLPVHAEDAHRHFLPLSQYRFVSPISYWDPRHHGRVVSLVEGALVFLCAGVILRRSFSPLAVSALSLVVFFYLVGFWRSFLRKANSIADSST